MAQDDGAVNTATAQLPTVDYESIDGWADQIAAAELVAVSASTPSPSRVALVP